MPIYLHPTSIIFNKESIKSNFISGIEGFKVLFENDCGLHKQEDNELYCFSRMNIDFFDLNKFIESGINFDKAKQFSNDFTIHRRYFGYLWEVNWIEDNEVFAWHKSCAKEEKQEMQRISNLTVDEILVMQKEELNPLKTIKLSLNINE